MLLLSASPSIAFLVFLQLYCLFESADGYVGECTTDASCALKKNSPYYKKPSNLPPLQKCTDVPVTKSTDFEYKTVKLCLLLFRTEYGKRSADPMVSECTLATGAPIIKACMDALTKYNNWKTNEGTYTLKDLVTYRCPKFFDTSVNNIVCTFNGIKQ